MKILIINIKIATLCNATLFTVFCNVLATILKLPLAFPEKDGNWAVHIAYYMYFSSERKLLVLFLNCNFPKTV
jgi:hypothetical protein